MKPPESAPPRPKPLVIGVGNPLRGDDGAGCEAVALLASRFKHKADFARKSGEATELMDAWEGRDFVIIIDAAQSGKAPGTVTRLAVTDCRLMHEQLQSSTHSFGVEQAIELSRALHTLPCRCVVYAIEGKNFGHGRGCSEEVERAMAEMIERVGEELQSP